MFLVSMIRDLIYMAKFSALSLSKYFYSDEIMLHDGDLAPVILIHGSGANNCEWKVCRSLIASYLANHPVYAINLSSSCIPGKMPDYEIEDYTDIAANSLQEICANHDQPAILVGHSMGGLVALNLLEKYSNYIETIITISSPIQGAPLLNYSLFKYVLNTKRHKQMTPQSEFLQKIYDIIQASDKKILSIGSLHDIHVPNEYARVPVDLYSNLIIDNYISDQSENKVDDRQDNKIEHNYDLSKWCDEKNNTIGSIKYNKSKYEHYTMSRYGHGSIINNHEVWNVIKVWIDNIV